MTKKDYISMHPKSYLAHNLLTNNWPDNTKIRLGGGLIAPTTKHLTSTPPSKTQAENLKWVDIGSAARKVFGLRLEFKSSLKIKILGGKRKC